MIIVRLMEVLALLALILFIAALVKETPIRKFFITEPTLVDMRKYTLYSTPKAVEDKWQDLSLVGMCDQCRLDDAPIVKTWQGQSRCKWCVEKALLDEHVKNRGFMAPDMQACFWEHPEPPKPPGGSGGGSPNVFQRQVEDLAISAGTDIKELRERLKQLEARNQILEAKIFDSQDIEVTNIMTGDGQVVRRILSQRYEHKYYS